MNDMVVSVDAEGRIKVRIPLSNDILSRYRGTTITVPFRLFEFSIQLDEEVTVPLASHSFVEAEKIANAVAASVMQAVTGWETAGVGPIVVRPPAQGFTVASRGVAEGSSPALGMPVSAPALSLMDLFEAWAEHHLRAGGAPTTPPYWRVLVGRFAAFVGHVPPAAVTSQQVRDYRDHLLASGRKLRTARHADFAALRALFHFAVENGHVPTNPVTGVKFRVDRLAVGRGMLAFNADEARQILAAADRQTVPAFRWIPWLTALTGSRVATIANLRPRDVQNVEGIWCLRITREAGPIKTAASERLVPIHPAILQRGFLAFVRDCGRERLFVEGRRRGADPAATSPYNPARSTLRRLTQWLHDLDLEIGREHRKDPNHAWRHWFKEQAFIAGIPEKIADAIVGHAHASASRRYGAVSLEVMARNLEKIRPPV